MKNFRKLAMTLLAVLVMLPVNAQFLNRLIRSAGNAAENAVQNNVNRQIDRAIDDAFEDNQNNQENNEYEPQQQRNYDEDSEPDQGAADSVGEPAAKEA